MIKNIKKQLILAIVGYILLVLWFLSYKFTCYSLLIIFIISAFVFRASYEYAKAKKLCIANCYFKENSFLFNFFTRKSIIFIITLIQGVILSLFIMTNIIVFNMIDFLILFLDIFIIIFLYYNFMKIDTFNKNIKSPIIKNSAVMVNAVFITLVFLISNLYQTPPEYIQNGLIETFKFIYAQNYSLCPFVDKIIWLSTEIIGIKWWILLDMTINIENKYYFKEIIWSLYLLGSYFMAFAYGRYILECSLFTIPLKSKRRIQQDNCYLKLNEES